MKKFIAIISSVLVLSSCSDFLNIAPEGTTSSTGLDYSKAENIFKPVSAAYASMRVYGAHDVPYFSMFEITSDNADSGSEPGDTPLQDEMNEFKYGPSHVLINNLWVDYYNIISAANNAIYQMSLFRGNETLMEKPDNAKTIDACEAEAKFIRAYAYFNLVRCFGNLPLIDKSMSANELAALQQTPKDEMYDFIKKELGEAAEKLPASYTKNFSGRITKYTAYALKAKVHLYCAEYDSVAVNAGKVMASNQYRLMPTFREVFSIDGENCAESLFEIQCSDLGQKTGNAPFFEYAYHQGPRGNSPANMQGWGLCTPSNDLIKFYTDRGETIRPATTLLYRGTTTPEGDYISDKCTNPVYNGKVYTPSSYNNWNYNGYGFDHNVRILRYADVLLMYAEAIARGAAEYTNSPVNGVGALNLVRARAGLADATLSVDTVLDERRAELALEEDRFFDLVRSGKAASVLGKAGFKAGKNEVFPIPAEQRQLNTNLIQNPNY
jgi:hypothetical protein